MSSEILSQNDIDALLGGKAAGRAPVTRVNAGPEALLYDFRRPHRVSKERLRTLEAMYERLVKSLEGWILGRVRGHVELTLQGVEQLSFGEFALSLPTPCCSYVIDIHDSGGQQGVIDFGHEFAYFLVDRLLGGKGDPMVAERALTPIERMVVRTVAERTTLALREIWEDYIALELVVSGFESIPEILRATGGDEPVLVASIGISAAGAESLVSLCLPFSVLDTFFADSQLHRRSSVTGSEQERAANREVVTTNLRSTSLDIAARLPEFRIPMKTLMSLRAGSVLSTGIPCDSDVEVFISGQQRYTATAARVGRRLAVSLKSPLPAERYEPTNPSIMEEAAE
jgi:flagellar motor switch protein FliM